MSKALMIWPGLLRTCVLGFGFVFTVSAGTFTYHFRDSEGNYYESPVVGLADGSSTENPKVLLANGDTLDVLANAYSIFETVFTQSDGMKAINQRIGEKQVPDITVVINACGDASKIPEKNTGSWSTGPKIQLWQDHYDRALGVLAHEAAGHSFMSAYYGGNPTDGMSQTEKYGNDEKHYLNELTTKKSAFSEGFAEFVASVTPGTDDSSQLKRFSEFEREKQKPSEREDPYTHIPFKDCTAKDLWESEMVNALILRDLADKLGHEGKDRIFEFIRSGGRVNTLEDFIQQWVMKYPQDTAQVIAIIDANTNFTMTDQELRDLLGSAPPALMPLRLLSNVLSVLNRCIPFIGGGVSGAVDQWVQTMEDGWASRRQQVESYLSGRSDAAALYKNGDIGNTLNALLAPKDGKNGISNPPASQTFGASGTAGSGSAQSDITLSPPPLLPAPLDQKSLKGSEAPKHIPTLNRFR